MSRMITGQGSSQQSARGGGQAIACVSTFPPRKCGIATYTEDLTRAIDDIFDPAVKTKIVAMNPDDVLGFNYPRKVIFQITEDKEEEYLQVARQIEQSDDIKLVNIQHEFGIFGGELGSHVITFLQALRKPKVITFHTVMPQPDENRLSIVRSLAENVSAIIVMTPLSKKILTSEYGISSRKITVIPHGIHPRQYSPGTRAKAALGFSDRVVLSTFGLLGSSKGLEYVIDALPQVVKHFPDFVYIYFGATHPAILRDEGESYRNQLIEKVYRLGLYDHVKFYNRYFPLGELLNFLKATDIYVSPSLEPNQAVSGTLTYAMGMGRPVISTAFANARELITDDVGILVDFRSPQAYAGAIMRLLEDEELRMQMGRNAYFRTRNMIWPNVALKYFKVFSDHTRNLAEVSGEKSLPRIKLDHMIRLTDDFGIVQHARLTRPDRSSGYTLDDNSRALAVAVTYYSWLGSPSRRRATARQRSDILRLVNVYLNFIEFVTGPDGRFANFVDGNRKINRKMNEEANLEESNARGIYALALTSATGTLPRSVRQRASSLLERRLSADTEFDSPRAIAFLVKAICLLLERKRNEVGNINLQQVLRDGCDALVGLYEGARSPDWQWFEEKLAYSNASLPEALLVGYRLTRDERYLTTGRKTLDFLVKRSFVNDVYVPVGEEGWQYRGSKLRHFDQQPEEVRSMVYALKTGYRVTRKKEYLRLMFRAFDWFLGDNTLNQVVYDRITGGCYDGVGRKGVNLNQGAEATISYLLARLAFEQ
ncbi:MAG: glycosyltransferase [Dehalococcoidia bacterium]